MTRHTKRNVAPKNWPIPRKGTKYVVKPKSSLENSIPLLILLRDVLKITKTKKEVKQIIHEKKVKINSRGVISEKEGVMLFDVLVIKDFKNYKLDLSEKGKFTLKEISEKDLGEKISKVINKKMLNKKKVQINLSDGRNYLSDLKCKVNDSVVVDLEKKKIVKCLELKEGAEVLIVKGKHAGERGKIDKIYPERKMVRVKEEDRKTQVLIKQMIVVK